MGYTPDIYGRGKTLSCDRTTIGARLISSIPLNRYNVHGYAVIRLGDKTSPCPKYGQPGVVVEGESRWKIMTVPVAVDRCEVHCDCPPGSNGLLLLWGSGWDQARRRNRLRRINGQLTLHTIHLSPDESHRKGIR
ncbi:PAAR domain-containing protein [Pluralibacter gergoviae]